MNLNECDSKDRDVKGEKERGEGGGYSGILFFGVEYVGIGHWACQILVWQAFDRPSNSLNHKIGLSMRIHVVGA